MSDYYETDGSCRRCLRSSPACSLIGLILVFLGTVGFGTGAILFRKMLMEEIFSVKSLELVDYSICGFIGAIVLFTILSYILCSLSTGYNSKRCFDTSRKSCCGRCCNMFLILCLMFGIILWIIIFSCTSKVLGDYISLMVREWNNDEIKSYDFKKLFTSPSEDNETTADEVQGELDLTYYGFTTKVSIASVNKLKEKMFLCIAAAYLGELLILIGYIIMIVCVAMNYSRLQERRYYEAEDGDETIALR